MHVYFVAVCIVLSYDCKKWSMRNSDGRHYGWKLNNRTIICHIAPSVEDWWLRHLLLMANASNQIWLKVLDTSVNWYVRKRRQILRVTILAAFDIWPIVLGRKNMNKTIQKPECALVPFLKVAYGSVDYSCRSPIGVPSFTQPASCPQLILFASSAYSISPLTTRSILSTVHCQVA